MYSLLVAVLILLQSTATHAWVPYLHMVVMKMAIRNMDAENIKALNIVLSEPKWKAAYPQMASLVPAAVFADVIMFNDHKPVENFEPLHIPDWHFTDVRIEQAKSNPLLRRTRPDVIERVSGEGNPYDNTKNLAYILEKTIKDWNKSDSFWYQNFLLRYFIHVLADAHQPLHASTWISPEFPNGDNGGIKVVFEKSFRCRTLHKLWDSALKLFPDRLLWIPRDGEMTAEFQQQLNDDVEFLVNQYPISKDKLIDWEALESLPFEEFQAKIQNDFLLRQIIDETSQVAEKYTRNGLQKRKEGDPVHSPPGKKYMKTGQEVAAKQLVLAGWRTSRLLNILGKQLVDNDRFKVTGVFNMDDLNGELN